MALECEGLIGPLQDPVAWYGINYTGTQITQSDFQNKEKSGWTGKSLEVPLRYLRPSVIYSVPCARILQRAYCFSITNLDHLCSCHNKPMLGHALSELRNKVANRVKASFFTAYHQVLIKVSKKYKSDLMKLSN